MSFASSTSVWCAYEYYKEKKVKSYTKLSDENMRVRLPEMDYNRIMSKSTQQTSGNQNAIALIQMEKELYVSIDF